MVSLKVTAIVVLTVYAACVTGGLFYYYNTHLAHIATHTDSAEAAAAQAARAADTPKQPLPAPNVNVNNGRASVVLGDGGSVGRENVHSSKHPQAPLRVDASGYVRESDTQTELGGNCKVRVLNAVKSGRTDTTIEVFVDGTPIIPAVARGDVSKYIVMNEPHDFLLTNTLRHVEEIILDRFVQGNAAEQDIKAQQKLVDALTPFNGRIRVPCEPGVEYTLVARVDTDGVSAAVSYFAYSAADRASASDTPRVRFYHFVGGLGMATTLALNGKLGDTLHTDYGITSHFTAVDGIDHTHDTCHEFIITGLIEEPRVDIPVYYTALPGTDATVVISGPHVEDVVTHVVVERKPDPRFLPESVHDLPLPPLGPRVRLVHAAESLAEFVALTTNDGRRLTSPITFGQITRFSALLPSGKLVVMATSESGKSVATLEVECADETTETLVLSEREGGYVLSQFSARDTQEQTDSPTLSVKFVNFIAGKPAISFYGNRQLLARDVAYGDTSRAPMTISDAVGGPFFWFDVPLEVNGRVVQCEHHSVRAGGVYSVFGFGSHDNGGDGGAGRQLLGFVNDTLTAASTLAHTHSHTHSVSVSESASEYVSEVGVHVDAIMFTQRHLNADEHLPDPTTMDADGKPAGVLGVYVGPDLIVVGKEQKEQVMEQIPVDGGTEGVEMEYTIPMGVPEMPSNVEKFDRSPDDTYVPPHEQAEPEPSDTPMCARVRVLHAVAGLSSVDVVINDVVVGSNVGYSSLTRYTCVPRGKLPIKVVTTLAPHVVITTDQVGLGEGRHYTVVVGGRVLVDQQSCYGCHVIAYDDTGITKDPPLGKGNYVIRGVHAAKGVPRLMCQARQSVSVTFFKNSEYGDWGYKTNAVDMGHVRAVITLDGEYMAYTEFDVEDGAGYSLFVIGTTNMPDYPLRIVYVRDTEPRKIVPPQLPQLFARITTDVAPWVSGYCLPTDRNMLTLIGRPDLRLGASEDCEPEQRLIFIKTHKSGSSTLISMLYRFAMEREIVVALPQAKGSVGVVFESCQADVSVDLPGGVWGPYDMLLNHAVYHPGWMRAHVPDAKLITLVREPISRFVSSFDFFHGHRISGVDGVKYRTLTERIRETLKDPEKVARLGNYNNYVNSHAADLGMGSECIKSGVCNGIRARPCGDPKHPHTLEQIMEHLENEFDLVLVQDRYAESVALLGRMMCWCMSDIVYHNEKSGSHKVSTSEVVRSLTEEERQQILEINSWDAAIYKKSVEILERKLSEWHADTDSDHICSDYPRPSHGKDVARRLEQDNLAVTAACLYPSTRISELCDQFVKTEMVYTGNAKWRQVPDNVAERAPGWCELP